jgi:glycosyltransferase involved in cell wall biosynthesis
MHLLILGGSSDHPGGVEAFCERSRLALLRRDPDWRVTRLPTNTAYLAPRGLRRFAAGLEALRRYRSHKPDCVWLQYVNLPDLAYLIAAKTLGMRVMVTPHLGANWRSQTNRALRAASEYALSLADRMALISRTQEREIALHDRPPRSLIRNFLPAEILGAPPADPATRPATLQLIHSGRLSEGKGSFLVIDVCAKLRDAGVPFEARITGGADRETYDRLAALIERHGLGNHVSVLGRVPEEELLAHLRGADVLVHLSSIDSYPLIVLEAMACATLPVCMELAGARDQIETYGGHVVSVAQAVDEAAAWLAAQDLGELRRLGREAAARVRADYDWDACAAALNTALRACVAGDRRES